MPCSHCTCSTVKTSPSLPSLLVTQRPPAPRPPVTPTAAQTSIVHAKYARDSEPPLMEEVGPTANNQPTYTYVVLLPSRGIRPCAYVVTYTIHDKYVKSCKCFKCFKDVLFCMLMELCSNSFMLLLVSTVVDEELVRIRVQRTCSSMCIFFV